MNTHAPESASSATDWLVQAAGLRVEFGRTVAVADVDLQVGRGEFVAVMGPSGSGKSTLLYCLAGLERPTAGRVLLAGADVGALDMRRRALLRRDQVAFVFQQYNLLPFLSVRDNVTLPLRMAAKPIDRPAIDALLGRVGLAELGDAMPARLSGGEQQRVAIARALAGATQLVLADEPTGALDTRTSAAVLDLLEEIPASGRTIVMVTHDPVAASRAQRVVYLSNGRIAGQARGETPAEIAAHVIGLCPAGAA